MSSHRQSLGAILVSLAKLAISRPVEIELVLSSRRNCLMEEENCLGVEEDGVDVLVGARRGFGRRRHFKRPEKTGN